MVESQALGKGWQAVMESSTERLQYLYTSNEYSDLDIVFPKDEITFKAHRLILAMSSPVFGTMFMGTLPEGKEITLKDVSPQALRKLLDHMYLDQMDLESVETALEVYALAHKYQMDSAREDCVQYILANVKEETALAVLETSVVYEDKALKKKCDEMIRRNPDAVMLSETVSHLSKGSMRGLLESDGLQFSSEVVPFKGLIAWGEAQLSDQEKEEPSGAALREKIGDLLKEVRFLTMSCKEFVANVIDTNVLSHTECVHIQRAIVGTDPSTVPEATPLNPTRIKRYSRPVGMEEMSCCKLRRSQDTSFTFTNIYNPRADMGLIENLSSNVDISIHYLEAPSAGTVRILDNNGSSVGSANSGSGLFIFEGPARLQKDKQYRVVLSPKTTVYLHSVDGGSTSVGIATLSYSQSHECQLYFCKAESTSNAVHLSPAFTLSNGF